MGAGRTGGNTGGIGLGGILVIVGIVLMIVWSFWIGLIIALIGLVAFGGFAKGKWYLPTAASPPSRDAQADPRTRPMRRSRMTPPAVRRPLCRYSSVSHGRSAGSRSAVSSE